MSADAADLMRHALAWPHCWRNYYCCCVGSEADETWKTLVAIGHANVILLRGDMTHETSRYYRVTTAGRDYLSSLEGDPGSRSPAICKWAIPR